jgi:hypothetical protein
VQGARCQGSGAGSQSANQLMLADGEEILGQMMLKLDAVRKPCVLRALAVGEFIIKSVSPTASASWTSCT